MTAARYRATWLVLGDRAGTVIADGVLDVDAAGRLSWVGTASDAPPHDGPTTTLPGVVVPGLVNTHCHTPMTLFRGVGEGLPLDRWLREAMWPREDRLTEDDVYWGMALGSAEMLRYGVTTSTEMYFYPDAVARAVHESGARALVAAPLIAPPGPRQVDQLEAQLAAALDQAGKYAGDDQVEICVGPHSAYVLPVPFVAHAAARARDHGMLMQIHVSETESEGRGVEREYGVSIPRALADNGALGGRVLGAHCVWMSDDDLRLWEDYDVAVAHCPQSNAKLASGTARLAEMLERGIRVGLGTDGPASNNNLDLWEEMRLAVQLARLSTMDAQTLPVAEAFWLATGGGAAAIGRDDIGVLEAGRWADFVRLDTDDAAFVPIEQPSDVLTHLVWSGGSRHVRDTWVGGRAVVANGESLTVDEVTARREVQQRAERLARG